MALATLSVACLIYWIVSINTSRADPPQLGLGRRLGTIVATDGFLEVRSDLDLDLARLDELANFPQLNPGIVVDRGFNLPGARFRMLQSDFSDRSDWAVEISFLVLSICSAALTVLFFCTYRIIRRAIGRPRGAHDVSNAP